MNRIEVRLNKKFDSPKEQENQRKAATVYNEEWDDKFVRVASEEFIEADCWYETDSEELRIIVQAEDIGLSAEVRVELDECTMLRIAKAIYEQKQREFREQNEYLHLY